MQDMKRDVERPKKGTTDYASRLLIWLGIALLLRLVLAFVPLAFWIDMGTFKAWSIQMATKGAAQFYSSVWCDYPPVYMYFLGLWGKLYSLFDPSFAHSAGIGFTAWIKFPPILADVLGSFVLFKLLQGKVAIRSAYKTAIFYAFNPLTLFVSAVWGQMDAVLILCMLATAWLLLEKRLIPACLLATVGVLIKPQGLFILPLILFTQWYQQKPWKWLAAVGSSLVLTWALLWPATPGHPLNPIAPFRFLFEKMMATAATYPYSTVNAFNIWAMTGNWKPDSRLMLGVPHRIWGLLFIASLLVGLAIYLYRNRNLFAFFLASSMMLAGFFLLPTRMHERYLLPAIAFLAIASAINHRLRPLYWGFTVTALLNVTWVFFLYLTMKNPPAWFSAYHGFIEGGGRTLFVLTNMWIFGDLMGYLGSKSPERTEISFDWLKKLPIPTFERPKLPWGKLDWAYLFGIPTTFFLVGLWRLGIPNEQIFDEVYHARTAIEYLKGITPYEWTHPPLAKLIVAVGIQAFGQTGFGWRITSLFFGALALMVFYLVARKTFESRRIGWIATGLLALDGVFFVQSRVAMTNIYVVFFLLVAAWGLISYLKEQHEPFLWAIGLGLGGALASRWSAMYAWGVMGAFLGAYWLFVLRKQWTIPQSAYWIARCVVYFVGIPLVIYALSYIPYLNQGHTWREVLEMQRNMWGYHANLHATHSYATPWYHWPLMIRPTWYYFHDWKNGTLSGIDCIGNPAIWWMGIPALLALGTWVSNKFTWNGVFPIVMALGLYLPWAIQPRPLVFMHYMFEAIPFMVLAMAFILDFLWEKAETRKFAWGYLGVAFVLFWFFYPMLSGLPMPWDFYKLHIWMPTWI